MELDLEVALPDRSTLADRIYDTVRGLVVDQHISAGSRINIEDLARRLRVSSTPVREALARLEADKLVTKEPLRGYLAAPALNAAGFAKLYEVRMLLEPYAASLACPHLDDHDLDQLEAALRTMRHAPTGASYQEYRVYSDADAGFHAILAERCGNELLADSIRRLHIHPQSSRLYFRHKRVAGQEATAEHERILAALRSRDAALVRHEMEEHVRNSGQRVQQTLAAISDEVAQ